MGVKSPRGEDPDMRIVRRGLAVALTLCIVPAVAADGPDASKVASKGVPKDVPKEAPKPQLFGGEPEPQSITWKATRLEFRFRHHEARLHRLRELAAARGDSERVAQLDKLQER